MNLGQADDRGGSKLLSFRAHCPGIDGERRSRCFATFRASQLRQLTNRGASVTDVHVNVRNIRSLDDHGRRDTESNRPRRRTCPESGERKATATKGLSMRLRQAPSRYTERSS